MRWCVGNPPEATNSRRSFGRLRAGPPASTVNEVAAGVFNDALGVPCVRGALLERIGFADGCTAMFGFECTVCQPQQRPWQELCVARCTEHVRTLLSFSVQQFHSAPVLVYSALQQQRFCA